MSKEMSMESIYANGTGIVYEEKKEVQTQESFKDASKIDTVNVELSKEYLQFHAKCEKKFAIENTKLLKKLNKEYGKHSQTLESYLSNKAKDIKDSYSQYINTSKELLNTLV